MVAQIASCERGLSTAAEPGIAVAPEKFRVSVCLWVCVYVCPPLASELTFSLLGRSWRAFFSLNRCDVACGAVERDFRFRPSKNLENSFSEVYSKLRSFSPPSDLPSRATLGAVSTLFSAASLPLSHLSPHRLSLSGGTCSGGALKT